MAAQTCSGRGLRTLPSDRSDGTMEKCCAGGVLDRSIKQLGYALPERTIQKEIHGVKIFHGEQSFDFEMRDGVYR